MGAKVVGFYEVYNRLFVAFSIPNVWHAYFSVFFSLIIFTMMLSVSTIPGEAIIPIFRMVSSGECPLIP